jgi:hypothetical protein
MQVSPNPASSQINVRIDQLEPTHYTNNAENLSNISSTGEYEIKLYDSYSQLRWNGTTNRKSLQIDVSRLPAGNYYLRGVNSKEVITKQIIIQP